MNFKSVLNDVCCDNRIKDGVIDLKNEDHVFVLQEYLENIGFDINTIVEKTAQLFEAGKFPDRQAYNKDGILVTFPSKEYRDRAVNKGTHFAENPKKAQANIFTEPPADVQPEEPKGAVPVDTELEKDIEDEKEDGYEDRTPLQKVVDAQSVDSILTGETPLVNYSVDEAKRFGFYNKGMLWYDTEGNLIGEQIFDEKIGAKVVAKKDKPEIKAELSEVEILRQLGLDKFEDSEILNHINDDIKGVTLSPGPNNKYGLTTPVNIDGLQNILRKEGELVITYSGNTKKIRTKNNIRVAEWSTAKSTTSIDFKRALMVYKFYIKNKDSVNLVAKEARGIGYEKMQVDNLNTWFEKHKVTTPLHLFISDEMQQFRDTGVNVNSAKKITGVGKADLALQENGIPKFWISYKHGNYWTEEGSTLANVPFQQYGSIKTLHKRLSTEKSKWNEIINNFLDKLLPTIEDKKTIKKGKRLEISDNDLIYVNDASIFFTPKEKELILANHKTLYNIFKNPANENLNKVLCFVPNGFGAWQDMLDGTDEARQIAGMSIYGLDFKLNSKDFGPENVQCLIQTNQALNVDYNYDENNEPDGMKISTDQRGHILFNPNLPTPKDAEDPILQYRPVLNARYTEEENFVFTRSGSVIVLLGCRILIMPYGKIPGTAKPL